MMYTLYINMAEKNIGVLKKMHCQIEACPALVPKKIKELYSDLDLIQAEECNKHGIIKSSYLHVPRQYKTTK